MCLALDGLAEQVVEAEQAGGEEEEAGGNLVVETEGEVINGGRVGVLAAVQERRHPHNRPEYVDHAKTGNLTWQTVNCLLVKTEFRIPCSEVGASLIRDLIAEHVVRAVTVLHDSCLLFTAQMTLSR